MPAVLIVLRLPNGNFNDDCLSARIYIDTTHTRARTFTYTTPPRWCVVEPPLGCMLFQRPLWNKYVAAGFAPSTSVRFPFHWQFCAVAGLALLFGGAVTAQRYVLLMKTRLLLQYSCKAAALDVCCVFVLASVSNSLLGTFLVPVVWALMQPVGLVSVGVEAFYFAVLAPLLVVVLIAIATVRPLQKPRPKNVARPITALPLTNSDWRNY